MCKCGLSNMIHGSMYDQNDVHCFTLNIQPCPLPQLARYTTGPAVTSVNTVGPRTSMCGPTVLTDVGPRTLCLLVSMSFSLTLSAHRTVLFTSCPWNSQTMWSNAMKPAGDAGNLASTQHAGTLLGFPKINPLLSAPSEQEGRCLFQMRSSKSPDDMHTQTLHTTRRDLTNVLLVNRHKMTGTVADKTPKIIFCEPFGCWQRSFTRFLQESERRKALPRAEGPTNPTGACSHKDHLQYCY